MTSTQIKWTGDLAVSDFSQLDNEIRRAMVAAAGKTAPEAEAWMKQNANWIDRTSNARNGLGARSVVSDNRIAVVLYHSVPYGIWLEVRWDGKYAVIEPAIREFAPRLMSLVAQLAFDGG